MIREQQLSKYKHFQLTTFATVSTGTGIFGAKYTNPFYSKLSANYIHNTTIAKIYIN